MQFESDVKVEKLLLFDGFWLVKNLCSSSLNLLHCLTRTAQRLCSAEFWSKQVLSYKLLIQLRDGSLTLNKIRPRRETFGVLRIHIISSFLHIFYRKNEEGCILVLFLLSSCWFHSPNPQLSVRNYNLGLCLHSALKQDLTSYVMWTKTGISMNFRCSSIDDNKIDDY